MGKASMEYPVKNITGKVGKKSRIVYRQKTFTDEISGSTLVAKQEIYEKKKRNYKRHPIRESERANMSAFGAATIRMKEILKDPESEEYKMWRERWIAQLTKPEMNAKGEKVCYRRFDRYLVAKLKSSL